jgi:NAD(P)-dependent dehydrogenase (short-subunit alcohol dehydrogenase family)
VRRIGDRYPGIRLRWLSAMNSVPSYREPAVASMSLDLSGRTVVVTGASRGMGRSIAERFASAGARVVLWGRHHATVAEAAREIGRGAVAVTCDMGDRSAIPRAVEETLALYDRIDVLVNNAGMSGNAAPFLDMCAAAWDEIIAVNLTGPTIAGQLVARHMVDRGGGGVILQNASIAAAGVDGPYSHYSASKAGLLAVMRSMAVELAPFGIRVNAVSPGYTRTEMTTQSLTAEQAFRLSTSFVRVPLGRLIEPREVADAFVFLASDAASGITGTNVVVDGGLTANLYIMETLECRSVQA